MDAVATLHVTSRKICCVGGFVQTATENSNPIKQNGLHRCEPLFYMVAGDGIEPPTRGFSILPIFRGYLRGLSVPASVRRKRPPVEVA